MTPTSKAGACLALAALALSSGCAGESPDPPQSVAPVSARAEKPRPETDRPSSAQVVPAPAAKARTKTRASDDTVGLDSEGLLMRLPRTSLLALRFPAVERLGDAYRASFVADLLASPLHAAGRAEIVRGFEQFERKARGELYDYDELRSQLESVRGELVLALTSLDVAALRNSGKTMPFSVAVLFDAADDGEILDVLVRRAFREYENATRTMVACDRTSDEVWYRHLDLPALSLDVVRDRDLFLIEMSARTSRRTGAQILPVLARAESFAGSDLVRHRPQRTGAGETVVYEVHVHADPIWDAVRLLAPAEVKDAIAAGGFESIRGLSSAGYLVAKGGANGDADGLADVMMLHSPGGRDLISRSIGSARIKPAIARWIPPEHDQVGIAAFDLAAFFDGLLALVPEADRMEAEASLAEFEREHELDLRRDVIENLGPTFASGVRGDILDPTRRPLEFVFAVEVQDEIRLSRWLDLCVSRAGSDDLRKQQIEGTTVYSIPIEAPDTPYDMPFVFEPAFALADGGLLVASTPAVLRSALATGRGQRDIANRPLREALADSNPDAWMISLNPAPGGAGQGRMVGRRTPEGLRFDGENGAGRTGSGLFFVAPVVASIAIPKLLTARIGANEFAAIATLHAIRDGEERLRSSNAIDGDADGQGEYASIEELCAVVPPRGQREPLDPAPLGKSVFRSIEDGAALRNGYLFRVDLRASSGQPAAAANAAEKRFVAYAWPLEHGNTGVRAFAIDSEGTVFATANDGRRQAYSGRERPPLPEAWCVDEESRRRQFKPDVHLGGDGGTWRKVE